MNLTDINHWSNSYVSNELKPDDDGLDYILIKDLINKYILQDHYKNLRSVLEIGCCPGRFLTIFGKYGIELNGIDFIDSVDKVKNNLQKLSFKTGDFYKGDFCEFTFTRKFDIICSFGFIEHFTNYEEVIKKHLDIVSPGGFIIITTPNFRGWVQYLYHFLTDRPNMKKHVIRSMNPNKWSEILIANNFDIKCHGFVGDIFWDENPKKFRVQFWTQTIIKKMSKLMNKIFGLTYSTSSYCVILAQNKG